MDESEIIKKIDSKIKRLKNNKVKDFHEREVLRDSFYNKLFLYNYTKDNKKRKELFNEAKEIASRLPDLKGWPNDPKIFWDVESYGWSMRIKKEVREFISKELSKKTKGEVLSLGSGSCPYVENAVLVDISEKMLGSAKGCREKIVFDVEKADLPFKEKRFDCAALVFLLDYIKDPQKLIQRVLKVLKKGGKIFIVQNKKPVDDFYRVHEKKHLAAKELRLLLKGMNSKISEKKIAGNVLVFAEAKGNLFKSD